MTELQVRRIRFDFAGDDVPFLWQPNRPAFAILCNMVTFGIPGFEKFIVDATREAIPLIRDPELAEEADAFLRQEAVHSAAHLGHFRALARRWPGLQQTKDEVEQSFRDLTATKPLAWRLAYTAVIEATFTPLMKVFLDHEDKMFEPGDERVASLFLWHFVEEIEHRSAAQMIYQAVHGSYPYRLKTMIGVIKHVDTVFSIISRGFDAHVPASDDGEFGRLLPNGLSLKSLFAAYRAARQLSGPGKAVYSGVPKRELLAMAVGIVRAQGPNHDPTYENLPEFAARWSSQYDQEPTSVAHWYSASATHE